jgi:hypothetical protein
MLKTFHRSLAGGGKTFVFLTLPRKNITARLKRSFESERLVKGLTAAIEEKIKKAKRAKKALFSTLKIITSSGTRSLRTLLQPDFIRQKRVV